MQRKEQQDLRANINIILLTNNTKDSRKNILIKETLSPEQVHGRLEKERGKGDYKG